MYRAGRRMAAKRRITAIVMGCIVFLTIGGVYVAWRDVRRTSSETPAVTPEKTTEYKPQKRLSQPVDEPYYSLELPAGWAKSTRPNTDPSYVEWTGTTAEDRPRSLRIYVDANVQSLPINRLLPVTVNANKIAPGVISDSCDTFTGSTRVTPDTVKDVKPTASKWQQVNFICDLPNFSRNVAGTGSGEGINQVSVTGPTTGTHKYFFVYTDNTGYPDESIFTDILSSFQAK